MQQAHFLWPVSAAAVCSTHAILIITDSSVCILHTFGLFSGSFYGGGGGLRIQSQSQSLSQSQAARRSWQQTSVSHVATNGTTGVTRYLITNSAAWRTPSSSHASCGCNTITPFPAPRHIVIALHARRLKCTLTRGFHRSRHSHPHERWAEGQRRRRRPSRSEKQVGAPRCPHSRPRVHPRQIRRARSCAAL